ncbi:hypothetical protein ABZ307_37225 [Streptomyces griseorubiginosus]|uniref:hypothetical protein n=1 Tax=Streptomyces griseorubiginosus TaxID=67304 RepID=UPI0033A66F87
MPSTNPAAPSTRRSRPPSGPPNCPSRCGLVNHRAGDWDWEDWGSNIDARFLDNSWYYRALDTAITLTGLSQRQQR